MYSPTLYIGRVQFQFWVGEAMRFRYSYRKMAEVFANSEDPDQMPQNVASDLGLHCLPITLLGVSRLQWVNTEVLDTVEYNNV